MFFKGRQKIVDAVRNVKLKRDPRFVDHTEGNDLTDTYLPTVHDHIVLRQKSGASQMLSSSF